MQIGKLRNRLALQRLTETRDRDGGVNRAFVTFAEVWGQVRPLRGEELLHARQIEARTTHEVRIRQRDDVLTDGRISHLGRTFNILAIQDRNERHRENVMQCVEVLN